MSRTLKLTTLFLFGFLTLGIVSTNTGSENILVRPALAGNGW